MPAQAEETHVDAALAADSAPAAARGERWTFLAFLRRRPRFLLGYALVLGVDLTIAVISTGLAALVGAVLGAYIGLWEGGRRLKRGAAAFGLRVSDVAQAFPVFALALVLVAVLGQGVRSIVLAVGIVNIPVYLRIMRGQTLALRT